MENDEKDIHVKLVALVREAIASDEALRKEYSVGEKFRFVRERLKDLLTQVESDVVVLSDEKKAAEGSLAADEVLVYVYLYNAKGMQLNSWLNMLTPKVFYEYSVNRPIYLDKHAVEVVIRNKKDKRQHAYLTIAIKQGDILRGESSEGQKDALGNPLLKIREGSLDIKRLITFSQNEQDYILNSEGELLKKP